MSCWRPGRARWILASPCQGIKVTIGVAEDEHLVATVVQMLRGALRMEDLAGYPGFVLTVLDGYTGARWLELISQRPGLYDRVGTDSRHANCCGRPAARSRRRHVPRARPDADGSDSHPSSRRSMRTSSRAVATSVCSPEHGGPCCGAATSPAGVGRIHLPRWAAHPLDLAQ
jgi:hypothetical protein